MNSSGALVAEPAHGTVDLDETYGVLRAPVTADPGLVASSARDEFNQTAGALTGKTAPVGGTWTVVTGSDTDDFSVETSGKTAQRTAVNDGSGARMVSAGTTNYTDVVVQTDLKFSAIPPNDLWLGVFARCDGAAIANAFWAVLTVNSQIAPFWQIRAGQQSTLVTEVISAPTAGVWYTLRALVRANGVFAVWFFPVGAAPGSPVLVSRQDTFATGGARATGRVGLFDSEGAAAVTRNYDNFTAWVPVQDAVLHANQSAELRWDGMYREDSTGTAYGPVSHVVGDLPRLPPTVEGGTTEIFLKASRGDFDQLPDDGIDDLSARVTYRPCWLTVPGS